MKRRRVAFLLAAAVAANSSCGVKSSAAGRVRDESVSLSVQHNGPSISSLSYGFGRYVLVGQTGLILTSIDGTAWRRQESGTTASLLSIAPGDGLFVAVGSLGTILSSPDGEHWTARGSRSYPCFWKVVHGEKSFVAVGENGGIFTSADGTNWVKRECGASTTLSSVAYGAERFVAVGAGGTILAATDGVRWVKRASGTTRNLKSVAFERGEFVVAGCGGFELRSRDGDTWSERSVDPSPVAGGSEIATAGQDHRTLWAYDKGTYEQKAGKTWIELSPDIIKAYGKFEFTEVNRTEDYVFLFDASRNMTIRLSKDRMEWRQGDTGDWIFAYTGAWKN